MKNILFIPFLLPIILTLIYYGSNNRNSHNLPNSSSYNEILLDSAEIRVSGLKGLNTKEGAQRQYNDYGLSRTPQEFKLNRALNPIESPVQYIGGMYEGVGESRYDKDITSLTQLEDLENTRKRLQQEELETISIFVTITVILLVIIYFFFFVIKKLSK